MVAQPGFSYPATTLKGCNAPVLRRPMESGGLTVMEAHFGLVPFFSESKKMPRDTLNARVETIGTAACYRGPWKRRQFCLVPMMAFTEPNYESGALQWWDVFQRDGAPFAVAGLYDRWLSAEGESYCSFTLPTLNSGAHPLMSRFHKPGQEKRSVVVLPPSSYDPWLDARSDAEARAVLQLFDGRSFDTAPVELAKAPLPF